MLHGTVQPELIVVDVDGNRDEATQFVEALYTSEHAAHVTTVTLGWTDAEDERVISLPQRAPAAMVVEALQGRQVA